MNSFACSPLNDQLVDVRQPGAVICLAQPGFLNKEAIMYLSNSAHVDR